MKNLTYRLHKSKQSVFTAREIALILGQTDTDLVKSKINYYVKRGEIIALRRGIYAKDEEFSEYELATKIYNPSYISFDTVLSINGISFQFDNRIHTASYLSREIKVNDITIFYRKLKNEILLNPMGIVYEEGVAWATLERAFLDTIYLEGERYFDNLDPVNFEICEDLLPIYGGVITSDTLKSYADDK